MDPQSARLVSLRAPSPRYVSIKGAMQLADVSRRTIYNWLNAGKLEYVRTAGGQIRILEASLFRPGGTVNPPSC